jgi:hypothetical protein
LCQSILARVKKAGTKKQKYEKISEKKMPTPIEALKWLDICQFCQYHSVIFCFLEFLWGLYFSGQNLQLVGSKKIPCASYRRI